MLHFQHFCGNRWKCVHGRCNNARQAKNKIINLIQIDFINLRGKSNKRSPKVHSIDYNDFIVLPVQSIKDSLPYWQIKHRLELRADQD